MSKGSYKRPTQVPKDVWESNWENIFGSKKRQSDKDKTPRSNTDEYDHKPSTKSYS